MANRIFIIVNTPTSASAIEQDRSNYLDVESRAKEFLNKLSDQFGGMAGGMVNTKVEAGAVAGSSDAVSSSFTATFSAPPAAGETMTIGGNDLTFVNLVASLVIQDLTYSALESGIAGNDISIEYLDPAGNDQPLSVDVTGSLISVSLETDGIGAIISTADDVLAAIEASEDASALVSVELTGTGSNVQAAEAEANLSGGAALGNDEVQRDGSPSNADMASRLADAINDSTTAALSGLWSASASGSAATISFKIPGIVGNQFEITESAAGLALSGLTSNKPTNGVGSFPSLTTFRLGY